MTQELLFALKLKDGPWRVRIDGPHLRGGERHVHMSRSGIPGEYSWNVSGSRHDEHRFPASEKHIQAAKRIAAKHLGVPQRVLQLLSMGEARSPLTVEVMRSWEDAASSVPTYLTVTVGCESDCGVVAVHVVTAPKKRFAIVVVTVGEA